MNLLTNKFVDKEICVRQRDIIAYEPVWARKIVFKITNKYLYENWLKLNDGDDDDDDDVTQPKILTIRNCFCVAWHFSV